jgi:hypothetical protein
MAQRRLPFSGFLPETGAADNNGEKKLGILLPVTVPVRLPTLTSFIIPHMLDAIVLTLSFTFIWSVTCALRFLQAAAMSLALG